MKKNKTLFTIITFCLLCSFSIIVFQYDNNEISNLMKHQSNKNINQSISSIYNFLNIEKQNQKEMFLSSRGIDNKGKYLGEFTLTAYCSCSKCCGTANNRCANGEYPINGVTIAADTKKIPFGTKVYIDGVGERVVMDTGSAIKGNKIDVYINSHSDCLKFGVKKNVRVWILNGER